jgi:superfamily II DNA or RNA helicase
MVVLECCDLYKQQRLNMTLRDEKQKEFAEKWIRNGKFGILNLCPRFGKIRTTINILNLAYPKHATVLIAYPDNKIKDSWIADFVIMGYSNPNITYTTHLSMWKYEDKVFDLVVIDEIHLLSEAQIESAKTLLQSNKNVLGLTGTLSRWTEETLAQELGLLVIAEYPIHQAVEEGVIVDYQIVVKTVPLDDTIKQNYKGKMRTEKAQFDALTWAINSAERDGRNTMFLRLARMRIIQNSIAKRDCTKRMLDAFKDDRILVFCGVTSIADQLGIPSYHSKKSEKQMFEKFAAGDEVNHMAVVKIGNTGVTYKPLNKVIINYFDSNAQNLAQKIMRCTAMEYDNPDKKAKVYIVCTNEDVERRWLTKALEFFDESKISYI